MLDERDAAIVAILQEDARATFSEIGKRVGIAPSTVHERVRRLERSGTITVPFALSGCRSAETARGAAIGAAVGAAIGMAIGAAIGAAIGVAIGAANSAISTSRTPGSAAPWTR